MICKLKLAAHLRESARGRRVNDILEAMCRLKGLDLAHQLPNRTTRHLRESAKSIEPIWRNQNLSIFQGRRDDLSAKSTATLATTIVTLLQILIADLATALLSLEVELTKSVLETDAK